MTWRPLRGERYVDEENEKSLVPFLTERLPYLDFEETKRAYKTLLPKLRTQDWALMGCNDRYFLLTAICGRVDALHPWLFARCREVEAEPDNYLDLWARDHYKSTIITFAGALQEIVSDPEITIGLFSFNQKIAHAFVKQVKRQLEDERMKAIYADALFEDPVNEAPMWTDHGFIVKRQTNPKEGTLEGWGLVNGQPTSKHYALRIYDDVVTRDSVTNEEMVKKVTEAYELSDNLGGRNQRKWLIGTRYSFADTYASILKNGIVRPRIYPATDNGKPDGTPVFLKPQVWENKKKEQSSQIAAQMLQNPLAGSDQVFRATWFRPFFARPKTLNVYILGDPSKGSNKSNDRTAIAVVGIDSAGNKYLLDGYRHRMQTSERWNSLRDLYLKWSRAPGVQMVRVGWERYGMQTDHEYFAERMAAENISFAIEEVAWTREGKQSKKDRVERLEPDFRDGRFFLPAQIHVPGSGPSLWRVDAEKNHVQTSPIAIVDSHGRRIGTRELRALRDIEPYRHAKPIVRKDEEGHLYDLTQALMEEMNLFPYGTHDDLVDATSRIYDMSPHPPSIYELPGALEGLNDFEDAA